MSIWTPWSPFWHKITWLVVDASITHSRMIFLLIFVSLKISVIEFCGTHVYFSF
jgi:hypothetical protein